MNEKNESMNEVKSQEVKQTVSPKQSSQNSQQNNQGSFGREIVTMSKSEMYKNYALVVLITALIVIGVVWVGGKIGGSPAAAIVDTGNDVPSQGGNEKVQIELGSSPSRGSDDAPVTIVEFSDFSCPFCGGASGANLEVVNYLKSRDPSWEAPVPKIMETYVKTGKVKYVFKYFPGHGSGQQAHLVGRCLYEQNPEGFWQYHDLVFAEQDNTNNEARMKELAVQSGADSAKLESCLESGKYDSSLTQETNEGRAAGVQGTPGFFVNGISVSGAQSFSAIQRVIESELSA